MTLVAATPILLKSNGMIALVRPRPEYNLNSLNTLLASDASVNDVYNVPPPLYA
jgi:hypothetical protein